MTAPAAGTAASGSGAATASGTAAAPRTATARRGLRERLATYLVTDAAACDPRGVLDVIGEAVAGGATAVQLREKGMPARPLLELVRHAARIVDGRALLLVDDRVDVALAARTAGLAVDGVHVGQSDLPVADVRRLLGPDAVVGLTANTSAHLAAVAALPPGTVDYLGVGVIRPTPTKPDHPAPLGFDGFAALAAAADLPCVAIGGLRVADTTALRRAGAAGLAVVSAVCAAPDPREAAHELALAWRAAA